MQIGIKMQVKRFPIATTFLVVLNIVVFVVGILSGSQTHIIQNYGFIPNHLLSASTGQGTEINNLDDSIQHDLMPSSPLQQSNQGSSPPLSYSLVTLFTSMFIHANIAHIAFNLLALVYLGGYAERAIGIPRYLLVYFASGIAAALFHGVIASHILNNGDVVLIGASGAISGVLGIAAVSGNTRAYYWLVFQIVFAVVGSVSAIPIAFTAHIGGFIAGALITKGLVKLEQIRTKSRYFLQP
jgi:rhomboid protease GluP